MRLHYLQHVPFEGLGAIASWAKNKRITITKTQLYSGEPLPNTENIDWLVVMGGPMGTSDINQYPWMEDELVFINKMMDEKKLVIGICLGAQLIAHLKGANIKKNQFSEIGWHDITLQQNALSHPFFQNLPAKISAFHWHGETFDIPKGATLAYSSKACKNQAFIIDDHIIGFQFHLETTSQTASLLIENCQNDLNEGSFVNSAEEIMTNNRKFEQLNAHLTQILDNVYQTQKNRDSIDITTA